MVDERQPRAERFNRWWPPANFFAVVRKHNERIPEVDFFERAEFQPLREAYAAGSLGYSRSSDLSS